MYGKAFEILFKSFRGNWRIELSQKDYTGSVTQLAGGADVANFALNNQGDAKHKPLKSFMAQLQIEVASHGQLASIFGSDAQKTRCRAYLNDALYFSGYVSPDDYSEPLLHAPYDIELQAICGLGLLQEIDFLQTDGSWYVGRMNKLEIIRLILEKIDSHELPMYIASGMYETRMTRDTNALVQQYVNVETYVSSDGDPLNCYDVLSDLLLGYRFLQQDGAWHATQLNLLDGTPYLADHYEMQTGQYTRQGSILVNPKVELFDKAQTKYNGYVKGSQGEKYIEGAKQLTSTQEYNLISNLFKSGDYQNSDWEVYPGNSRGVYWRLISKFPDSKVEYSRDAAYVGRVVNDKRIPAITALGGKLKDSFPIKAMEQGDNYLKVQLLLSVVNYYISTYPAALQATNWQGTTGDVNVMIKLGDYYLTKEGWEQSDEPIIVTQEITSGAIESEFDLSFIVPTIPIDGNLEITIYGKSEKAIVIHDVRVFFTKDDLELAGSQELVGVQNPLKANVLDDLTLLTGDVPELSNFDSVWYGGLTLAGNLQTKNWQALGHDSEYDYAELISRIALGGYSSDIHTLSATMEADINALSIVYDKYTGRCYAANGITYNVKEDEWSGEWIEVMPYAYAGANFNASQVSSSREGNYTKTSQTNNYATYGNGEMGTGKRVYELPLATDLEDIVLLCDHPDWPEAKRMTFAQKYPNFNKITVDENGNLLVPGNVIAYADMGGDYPSIFDSIPTATNTSKGLAKFSDQFTVVDGLVSISDYNSGLDETQLAEYLSSYATQQWVTEKNYLTAHQSLTGLVTETWVTNKNYLTAHQSLSAYAKTNDIWTKAGIPNLDKITIDEDGNIFTPGNIVAYADLGADYGSIFDKIPLATTTSKGIAQFNGANFSVIDGFVSVTNAGLNETQLETYLSNNHYAQNISSWAKASSKPTYTYSEVGALASSGTSVDSDKWDGFHRPQGFADDSISYETTSLQKNVFTTITKIGEARFILGSSWVNSPSQTAVSITKLGGGDNATERGFLMANVYNSNEFYLANNVVKSWVKLYHTGNKPSYSDVGAAASNHTHDGRYYTESESEGRFFRADRGSISNFDTAVTQGIYSFSTSTSNSPALYGSLMNILNAGDSQNGVNNWLTQLAFSTDLKMYMRSKINNYSNSAWQTFYTTSNKPSYSDVGALAANGKAVDSDKLDGITSGNFAKYYHLGSANIDSYRSNGIYIFDPIPTGTPPAQNPNICMLSMGNGAVRNTQIASCYSDQDLYFRKNKGSWGAWNRIYHSTNSNLSTIDWNAKNIVASGSIVASGNITAYSDMRLKQRTKSFDNVLDNIDRLSVFYYKRKDIKNDRGDHIGVNAQTVRTLYPEFVNVGGDTTLIDGTVIHKTLSVDYGKFGTAIAIQGLRETKVWMSKKDRQIAQLTKRVIELENQLIA